MKFADSTGIEPGAAESRLRAREQVLALLSHEMRTPLNGVLGMAGLLAATRLDPTQTAYLAALRDCGEHLLSLVNDVLDLAKLESGRVDLEPVDTDVERLLQGVCELLSPKAHAAGLEIAWTVARDVPLIRADDGRLRQILFNFAGNAVKLTRRGGVLASARLASRPPSAPGRVRLRFDVLDTGPGVRREDHARIFEEFAQTETGIRVGGAGLGLAIVKRLADAFGGEVGVDSDPEPGRDDAGAVFWFEAEFDIARPPAIARGQLAGLTVAVATPSEVVWNAARGQLEACGAQAVRCAAADEAAPVACTAVLVDMDAQGDVTPRPGNAPSIVLIAPEARGRIEGLRAAGFQGYLIKPLRRGSLAARILAVRSGARGGPRATKAPPADDERAKIEAAKGVRVLLAEDNPVNALLARSLLMRAGCDVDRVANGEEAVAALAGAPYDIVLMDMRMPGMDGPAAARAIRATGDRTPILALTANAFEDDRKACLEAGMDDFLTKPMDAEALSAALARWTARPDVADSGASDSGASDLGAAALASKRRRAAT